MKSKRWILLVAGTALSCLAAAIAVHSSLEAQEKKPPADRDNPFAGKILVVYSSMNYVGLENNDPTSRYTVLENPALSEVRGEQFLTGKRIAKRESPWHDLKTSIALETVGTIYEFDNVESYREFEERVTEEAEEAGLLMSPGIPGVVPVPDSE